MLLSVLRRILLDVSGSEIRCQVSFARFFGIFFLGVLDILQMLNLFDVSVDNENYGTFF